MPNVKYSKKCSYTHCLEIGEETFHVSHAVDEYTDPLLRKLSDGTTLVGYLCHDESCENPFDDCDGMGKIIDRRHCRSDEEREVQKLLGMKEYEDDDDFQPDPYCVLLDVYSHGGEVWSVHGGGMQCRWDTSRGAGLWVPDKYVKEHIDFEAMMACMTEGVTIKYEEGNTVCYRLPDGTTKGGFKSFKGAQAAAAAALGINTETEEFKAAVASKRHKFAVETVKPILETYNAWLSGDCYGVCVDTFDKGGELINEDACWGYIGRKFAEDSLKDTFNDAVAWREKKQGGENA